MEQLCFAEARLSLLKHGVTFLFTNAHFAPKTLHSECQWHRRRKVHVHLKCCSKSHHSLFTLCIVVCSLLDMFMPLPRLSPLGVQPRDNRAVNTLLLLFPLISPLSSSACIGALYKSNYLCKVRAAFMHSLQFQSPTE